jgi:uncharacterized repeat protein (TIGR03803 family)
MKLDGTDFRVEHAFTSATPIGSGSDVLVGSNYDGVHPWGSLAVNSSGVLYGVAQGGGAYGYGTLFEYNPAIGPSSFHKDWDFCSEALCRDGRSPLGSVAVLSDGRRVIGTTLKGGGSTEYGTAWVYDPNATPTLVAVELNTATTGYTPSSGFAQSSLAGSGAWGASGRGTVGNGKGATFYFDPNALTLTAGPAFPSSTPSVWAQYEAIQPSYVLGNDVWFPRVAAGVNGTGSLAEIVPTSLGWAVHNGFDFAALAASGDPGSNSTGAFPNGPLTADPDAPTILYGIASYGGSNLGTQGTGVIYSYNTSTFEQTVLYNFCQERMGNPNYPYGGLMFNHGILYGTTYVGSIAYSYVLGSGSQCVP